MPDDASDKVQESLDRLDRRIEELRAKHLGPPPKPREPVRKRKSWPERWVQGVVLIFVMFFGGALGYSPFAALRALGTAFREAGLDGIYALVGIIHVVALILLGPLIFYFLMRWVVASFGHWLGNDDVGISVKFTSPSDAEVPAPPERP